MKNITHITQSRIDIKEDRKFLRKLYFEDIKNIISCLNHDEKYVFKYRIGFNDEGLVKTYEEIASILDIQHWYTILKIEAVALRKIRNEYEKLG